MTVFVDENIPYLSDTLRSVANVISFDFKKLSQNELIQNKCEYLFVRSTIKVDSDLLSGTAVKFVGTSTAGTDHIDFNYLKRNNIAFESAPGSNANSVAEYVIFAVLHWLEVKKLSPNQKTIGIVGYGNIGKLVARHAAQIFPKLEILINDPPLKDAAFPFPNYLKYCELDELIQRSDVITNHVPKVSSGKYPTIMLFNKNNLADIKNGGLFIHSSRGGVASESALLEAKSNKDLMLVSDVWENEPQTNFELLLQSEIATPHVAGHSWNGKIRGSVMMLKHFEKHSGISIPLSDIPQELFEQIEKYNFSAPSKSSSSQYSASQLYEILKEKRQILSDSDELKATGNLSVEERTAKFIQFRKNYPKRFETLGV
ncbi:MAG: 4-phosphoerythronate dehydrogenase [Ignavibacteria bacterium]|jgi:erythronate-4-phosphate dehydrogenase|nr:4-phosphoerythronate dehydrogenase [Ignavibacteria bacterium]